MKRKNVAAVLAGGVGSRFGSALPKQFVEVAGKTIIEHSVTAFEENTSIDEIVVVMHKDYIDHFEKIRKENDWKKLVKVLDGGNERYMSSLAAIQAYEGQNVNLIFHDAVRPLVSDDVITEVVKTLEQHEALGVAVPATDTIIQVEKETMTIVNVPDRSVLFNIQTPQAFHWETIAAAYEKAMQDPDFKATDDCGVVKKYLPEVPIHVVIGSSQNIKLTYPEDLHLADKLLQLITEQENEN